MVENALDKLRAQLASTERAVEASRARLTDTDREELALRRQLDRARGEQEEVDAERRWLRLEQQLAALEEQYPGRRLAIVAVKGHDDSYVVGYDHKAYSKWQRTMQDSALGSEKRSSMRDEAMRDLAISSVLAWREVTDFSPSSLETHRLREHLAQWPAQMTLICNEVAALAGAAKEERKSTT